MPGEPTREVKAFIIPDAIWSQPLVLPPGWTPFAVHDGMILAYR